MKRLTDEQRQQVCARYLAGENTGELARAYGIARSNINDLLRRRGVEIRPREIKSVLTETQVSEVMRRYSDGEGTTILGREFGVNPTSIDGLLERRGLRRQNKKRLAPGGIFDICDVSQVCADYEGGESQYSIAKRIGVSRGAVLNLLNSRGLEIRGNRQAVSQGARRKYAVNHFFFHDIQSENQAYWLGFAAADGCVYKTRFQVGLASKDRAHIVAMARDMECDVPIRDEVRAGRRKSSIVISSPQIAADLTSLGLGPKKTFSHPWPHHLSDDLKRHFLRGYFDGDGTWYRNPKRLGHGYFSIISHTEFLMDAQEFLVRHCDLAYTRISPHERTAGIGRIFYAGNRQLSRIAGFLYRDATIFLPRKRDKVKHLIDA